MTHDKADQAVRAFAGAALAALLLLAWAYSFDSQVRKLIREETSHAHMEPTP